jgi:hypothetical protein
MHFTYKAPEEELQQGDVLKRTPELENVLKEVHPHYFHHQDYKYLIVLTQTCDLVRRGGRMCKSPYITLAAVRSLKTLLNRELSKHQRNDREERLRYCSDKARTFMRQFIERLLNNNEPGYFYLHEDHELEITEPAVAFLALSISIKSGLHYSVCLQARIAQLQEPFQAKLGWLVGNLYSRVGTKDWVPGVYGSEEGFDEHLDNMVGELCLWVNDRIVPKISQEEKRLRSEKNDPRYELTSNDLENIITKLDKERDSKKENVIERMVDLASDLNPEIDKEKFRRRLQNDAKLTQLLK